MIILIVFTDKYLEHFWTFYTNGFPTFKAVQPINTLLCPAKSNSKQIELKVHTSCYLGLRLTLCYTVYTVNGMTTVYI